jgi:hypothetical protein
MITTIIFSKNRACQLDLLLRSIKQNLATLNDIVVLYTYTSTEFQLGYDILKSKYKNIRFVEQISSDSFEIDIRYILLNECDNLLCFFVDDNIVYSKSYLTTHIIESLLSNPTLCTLSLRLGTNIKLQDPNSQQPIQLPQAFYRHKINDINFLLWPRYSCNRYGNFGYSFSVDGHIYSKDLILQGLTYDFDTPNAFEGKYNIDHFPEYMVCLEQSVVVNSPTNAVSNYNTAGQKFPVSVEKLNELFLDNFVIDLNSIMQTNVVSCHQEIPFKFIEE